jgi:uncharacterized lipoprotein YajG
MVNNTVNQYSLRDKIALVIMKVLVVFVICALLTQLYFVYCEIFKSPEENQRMANEMSWKFDGTFKNSPGNIWYDENEHIYVSNVTNLVKAGKLAGNRNLEFGVKNVLEEYLQEKGYDITPDAPFTLDVDIIYLDQLTTKKGISVFSKTDNAVVIKLKGTLYKEGLKQKEVEVEESSSEISIATLVVDQGGKFNQSSLSSALKKGCDKLITKLFEK